MRAMLQFGAVLVLIVLVVGALMSLMFPSPPERRAVWTSALVAVVVQLFAFAIARSTSQSNYLTGWVIGVALRFVTIVAYAFVAVMLAGLPAAAALITLVTLLFISTIAETRFLTLCK